MRFLRIWSIANWKSNEHFFLLCYTRMKSQKWLATGHGDIKILDFKGEIFQKVLTWINILWLLLQVVGLDSRTELAVLAYNVIVLGFPSSGRLHCFKVNYDGKKSRDNIGQHKFICQKFKRSIVAQYQCNIKLASKKMLKGLAIIAVFLDR